MTRILVIDDEALARAAKILASAEANPYRPGPGVRVPADDPDLVGQFNTYRVVFSYTEAEGIRCRHMSVSIPVDKPTPKIYPDPFAVFILAELFGFTGYDDSRPLKLPDDWQCSPHEEQRCVVVIQPIGSTIPRGAMS